MGTLEQRQAGWAKAAAETEGHLGHLDSASKAVMTSKSSRCKSFYILGALFINKEIATAHMTSALLMERHAGLTMTVMRRTQSICADRHRQEPEYTDETVLLFVDPTSHFVLHGGRLVAFSGSFSSQFPVARTVRALANDCHHRRLAARHKSRFEARWLRDSLDCHSSGPRRD
jgi:hypothetical protein